MEDGGDNVGVATSWSYPKVELPKFTVQDVDRALKLIAEGGPWRRDQRANQWVGTPIARVLGLDLSDKLVRRAVNNEVREWIFQGWLEEVDEIDGKGRSRPCVKAAFLQSRRHWRSKFGVR